MEFSRYTLSRYSYCIMPRTKRLMPVAHRVKCISGISADLTSEIAIGSGELRSFSSLGAMLADFSAQHPQVRYTLFSGNAQRRRCDGHAVPLILAALLRRRPSRRKAAVHSEEKRRFFPERNGVIFRAGCSPASFSPDVSAPACAKRRYRPRPAFTSSIIGRRSSSFMPGISSISAEGCASSTACTSKPWRSSPIRICVSV